MRAWSWGWAVGVVWVSASVAWAAPEGAPSKTAEPETPEEAAPEASEEWTPETPEEAAPNADAAPKAGMPASSKAGASASAKRGAPAAPKVSADEQLKLAEQHRKSGKRKEAIDAIDVGLAVAGLAAASPTRRSLLYLKGTLLLDMKDDAGSLAAYTELLKVAPNNATRVEVKKRVAILEQRVTTFLDIAVANGPAD